MLFCDVRLSFYNVTFLASGVQKSKIVFFLQFSNAIQIQFNNLIQLIFSMF